MIDAQGLKSDQTLNCPEKDESLAGAVPAEEPLRYVAAPIVRQLQVPHRSMSHPDQVENTRDYQYRLGQSSILQEKVGRPPMGCTSPKLTECGLWANEDKLGATPVVPA